MLVLRRAMVMDRLMIVDFTIACLVQVTHDRMEIGGSSRVVVTGRDDVQTLIGDLRLRILRLSTFAYPASAYRVFAYWFFAPPNPTGCFTQYVLVRESIQTAA
jgi:hypothetical protein